MVEAAKIDDAEKQTRLTAIDNARKMCVAHTDTLNNLLFKRRAQGHQSQTQARSLWAEFP